MSEIESIHTPCKSCVFAQYDGITQNGCHLNYLDKYRDNNIQILEAYDEEKEFYIINGKKCIGYRENKWFDQFNMSEASIADKINKYKETNTLDYVAVISLKNLTLDSLNNVCKQLASCSIGPKKIVFIRYRDENLSFNYRSIEQIIKDHNISCIWRIQTMIDETLTNEQILHDITSNDKRYRFLLFVNDNADSICEMMATINDRIHENLGQFMMGGTSNKSVFVYSTAVYRFGIAHDNNILLNNNDIYEII